MSPALRSIVVQSCNSSLIVMRHGIKVCLLKESQNVLHQYSGGKSRKENHSLYNHRIKEIVPKDRLLEVCISYYLVYLMQLMFGFGSLMSSRDGVITV